MFEVICGNIGRVYNGSDKVEAQHYFDEYVTQSKRGVGRAGHETVTMFEDGELIQEHVGIYEA